MLMAYGINRREALVRTPMAAVEGDGDRAMIEKIRQSDRAPLLIRQMKGRHQIAGLRCSGSCAALLKA